MSSSPVIVFGSSGQVGAELLLAYGDEAMGVTRREADLRSRDAVKSLLESVQPRAVINAAAYTKVDLAERESAECFAVNARAVALLAEECSQLDIPLIHISTDYVFGADQTRRVPYTETDSTGPLGVYAVSKLDGEAAALTWEKACVVRTAGVYAPGREGIRRGRNFVDTMLVLAETTRTLRIVDDQYCCTTYAPDLARAIQLILSQGHTGVFHVTNAGSLTWYEFAREIFRIAGIPVTLEPISTEQYGAPAPRPRYSVLNCSKYEQVVREPLPTWQDALGRYFAESRVSSAPQ